MANRTPLVINTGSIQVLQPGDTLSGALLGAATVPYSALSGAPRVQPIQGAIYPVLSMGMTGSTQTSGVAAFVYCGQLVSDFTANYIRFYVSSAGAGTQTAEVGIFSSASEPSGSALLLTKIVATGALSSLTTTGAKSNTSALGQTLTAGTHVWAAFRNAMATTQPAIHRGAGDIALRGYHLQQSAASALTSITTITPGTLAAGNVFCPNLVITG